MGSFCAPYTARPTVESGLGLIDSPAGGFSLQQSPVVLRQMTDTCFSSFISDLVAYVTTLERNCRRRRHGERGQEEVQIHSDRRRRDIQTK